MLSKPRFGEGRVGCILWLLALSAFVLVVWKTVPVKIKTAEFEDFMQEQAQFAGRSSGDAIKKRILARAKELDIPLDPKALTVQKSSRRVRIVCSYTIAVEFPFYTYYWDFKHQVDRQVFLI